jgi:DNA recombination protein RmuC
MEILLLVAGAIIGFALGYFYLKAKNNSAESVSKTEYDKLIAEKNILEVEKGRLEERTKLNTEEIKTLSTTIESERNKSSLLGAELSSIKTSYENLSQKLTEQKGEVEQLQERFKIEFKNIANEMLEDKSKRFTEQNHQKLSEILNPLNEKIKSFEDKVEKTHRESLEKNAGLVQQLVQLKDLNLQMSKDALNLTKALKGDSKMQGNWGEVILERVLEKSGLVKDREYFVQNSVTTEDGRRLQPDVVIHLPDNKNIVVDSKISLVDYEKFSSEDDEAQRVIFLKKHIQSLRNHVKGLSEKNYHQLYGAGSPDFVLLFVPIEPAFSLAVQHDLELFNDSFERNIVIVSTSTLLATLRTIASIWRTEYQNKNAAEIARQAGDLYDKFNGLVEDLIKVGKQMQQSRESYEDAMKKLSSGRGSLVSRTEKLKELGAKTSKSLPQSLLDRAVE